MVRENRWQPYVVGDHRGGKRQARSPERSNMLGLCTRNAGSAIYTSVNKHSMTSGPGECLGKSTDGIPLGGWRSCLVMRPDYLGSLTSPTSTIAAE
jgi:hypothetical protein